MPQGRPELHQKFDGNTSLCEDMIREAGGDVYHGLIYMDGTYDQEVEDAAEYLITEWDYAYVEKSDIERERCKHEGDGQMYGQAETG